MATARAYCVPVRFFYRFEGGVVGFLALSEQARQVYVEQHHRMSAKIAAGKFARRDRVINVRGEDIIMSSGVTMSAELIDYRDEEPA